MFGVGSTLRVSIYSKQITDLTITLDEWRLPQTTLSFQLEVKKQGESVYTFLVEG